MSDPLRTDAPHQTDLGPGADREEKIEQLLLAGLEHYFAAAYDQAITIWTRALFFDRGHARARAYIERARSAQAERQRESEELLQRGVAAFRDGAADEARRLLRDAMDQGAPPEEALAILERINRLEQVTAQVRPAPTRPGPFGAVLSAARPPTSRAAWALLVGLGIVIVTAGAFAAGAFRADFVPLVTRPGTPVVAREKLVLDEPPPLPRRGENLLTRARALSQSGRLRDALRTLDGIRLTDLQKNDADRLRADIQKQLIGMAAMPPIPQPEPRNAPEP